MADMSKGKRPLVVNDAQPDSDQAQEGWRPGGEGQEAFRVGHRTSYTDAPAPPFRETEIPGTVGKTGDLDEDWAAAEGSGRPAS